VAVRFPIRFSWKNNRKIVIWGVILAIALWIATTQVAFAQDGEPPGYREFPVIGSRVAIWITSQVHLMFAAFMLGVPLFALVVEYIGVRSAEKRYDDLAREFTKLIIVAASTTAAFGAVFTFLLFTLYPNYMSRLTDVFLPTMIIYPLLFFGEIFALYLYWYSWDRLSTPKGKPWHLAIGLLLNLFGTALMFIANAWLTFAISPESGGRSLTTTWAASQARSGKRSTTPPGGQSTSTALLPILPLAGRLLVCTRQSAS